MAGFSKFLLPVALVAATAFSAQSMAGLADNTFMVRKPVGEINAPPRVENEPGDLEIVLGSALNYTLPSDTFKLVNPPITYTATLADGSPLPAWLIFNPPTLTFSGTSPTGGTWNIRVTATSSKGKSASAVFTITIAPPASLGWGMSNYGQLGNGSMVNNLTPAGAPTKPAGINFAQFAAGRDMACALDTTGKAWCWGKGGEGQLGNGANADSVTPVAVSMPAGKSFTKIAVGSYIVCALDNAGAAWCWGDGSADSRLGNGTTAASNVPVAVTMPVGKTFTKLELGYFDACAIANDGSGWCWGSNQNGEAGDGSWNVPAVVPTAISTAAMPAGSTFRDITIGTDHVCAIISDGTLWCWGNDWSCRIGHGGWTQDWWHIQQPTPMAAVMPEGRTFTDVAAAGYTTCAIAHNGDAYCWGDGHGMPLGTDAYASCTPTVVTMPAGQSFTSIEGGRCSYCARGNGGSIWCWGGFYSCDNAFSVTPAEFTLPDGLVPGALANTNGSSLTFFVKVQ